MNQVITATIVALLIGACIKITRAEPPVEQTLSIELEVFPLEMSDSQRFAYVVGSTNSVFLLASPRNSDVMIMNMEGEIQETLRNVAPPGMSIMRFINTPEGTYGLYNDGILPFNDEGVAGEYIPFNSARYGRMRWYAVNGSKVLIVVMPAAHTSQTLLFDMESGSLTVGELLDYRARYLSTVAPLGDGFLTAWSTDGPLLGQIIDITGAPVGEEFDIWQEEGEMAMMLSSQSNSSGGVTIAFMEPNNSYLAPALIDVSADGSVSALRRYGTARDHRQQITLSEGSLGTIVSWEHIVSSSDFRTGLSTHGSIRVEAVDVNEYPKYYRFVVNGRLGQASSAVCGDKLLVTALASIKDENGEFFELRRVAGVFDRAELARVASESRYVSEEGVHDDK